MKLPAISPPIAIVTIVVTALGAMAQRRGSADDFSIVESVKIALPYQEPLMPRDGSDMVITDTVLTISRSGRIMREVTTRPVLSSETKVAKRDDTTSIAAARQIFSTVEPLYAKAFPILDGVTLALAMDGRGGRSRSGIDIHRCEKTVTDVPGDSVVFGQAEGDTERVVIAPNFCVDDFTVSTKRRIDRARQIALDALQPPAHRP